MEKPMSTPSGAIDCVRVVVVGAGGRMGTRLCALAHEDARFHLAAALELAGAPSIGRDAAPEGARGDATKITEFPANSPIFPAADVVIDFSTDAGAHASAALAQRIDAALLVGTTALTQATRNMLQQAAKKIPVLLSPNTSLGVTAMAQAVRDLARMLGDQYHCSIVEAHHIAKKDAPSGTAMRLAHAARAGGAHLPEDHVVSIRGGDVIGEHTVRFAGPGEYIELTHRATSRDLFARGALRCAAWLKGKPPKWWTMEDVLEIAAE
jgi:4-hydroxy-tetrahydrodipicolinate reductase